MDAHIIIGASYGDEGKGQVTAELCKKNRENGKRTLNVLTNGGSQRGHTVIGKYNGLAQNQSIYHVFHHFGAGTLSQIDNFFDSEFILNPMNFIREKNELESLGFDFRTIHIYCSKYSYFSTPYDMIANQIIENSRGDKRHGSVGVGIWETVKRYRKISSHSFYVFCTSNYMDKVEYMKNIKEYYLKEFKKIDQKSIDMDLFKVFLEDGLYKHFIADCEEMYSYLENFSQYSDLFEQYDSIVFENGQGLLLNSDPNNVHTTPSNTGCGYAVETLASAKFAGTLNLHYVTRPYLTRHGAGPLDGEIDRDNISKRIKNERTNVFSAYQGEFRYARLQIKPLFDRIYGDYLECAEILTECDKRIIVDITHCEEFPKMVEEIINFDPKVKYNKYYSAV